MVSRLKIAVFCTVLVIFTWVGQTAYTYFFSVGRPIITIENIEEGGWYGGDTQCVIKGKDTYKIKNISIALDGKPLVTNFYIGKKEFEYGVTIPTQTLANGKHALRVEAENGAYNKVREAKDVNFTVDNVSLQAAFVKGDADAKVFQGRTLHIQFQVNKEIKQAQALVLSKTYPCFSESSNSLIYECFIPIECEQVPNEYLLSIELTDRVSNTMLLETKFQVVMYPFRKQSLKFDPEKIKVENESGLSEKELEDELERLVAQSPKQKLWYGAFYTPVEIKEPRQITTEFGVIRTTQERGIRQHKALDIYNTPKSVVVAPQNGIVVLKGRYAHSGNTVVIDHGCGTFSIFFHLDAFAPNLEVGIKIKKGDPIGTVGKTGYATGYHVHWEMRIYNVSVDPMQWTKHDF
jgi:Peptidase family M23